MNSKIQIADIIEMEKRKHQAKEFYEAILDPYEHPWLVTDEASLYDITLEEDDDLIKKTHDHYGITIDVKYLSKPFWELIDYLEVNRVK